MLHGKRAFYKLQGFLVMIFQYYNLKASMTFLFSDETVLFGLDFMFT